MEEMGTSGETEKEGRTQRLPTHIDPQIQST